MLFCLELIVSPQAADQDAPLGVFEPYVFKSVPSYARWKFHLADLSISAVLVSRLSREVALRRDCFGIPSGDDVEYHDDEHYEEQFTLDEVMSTTGGNRTAISRGTDRWGGNLSPVGRHVLRSTSCLTHESPMIIKDRRWQGERLLLFSGDRSCVGDTE